MQPNNKFDLDLKFGQAGEELIKHLADDRKLEVKRDKLWRKTGNLFIETSCNGKPSGLMATESDYLFYLLDDGGKVVGGLLMDAPKLARALIKLHNEGIVRKIRAGDGGRAEGYLVPVSIVPTVFQLMAGVNVSTPRQSDNKQPIVITTDGSFRSGGIGAGHVILERKGSHDKRDDFRQEMTWQATIKDSYEAELRGVLEALKYLEQGKKRCVITIQCDHLGIVDTINRMAHQRQHHGHIDDIPPEMPCALLWHQVADLIQIHSFGAKHTQYNENKPETVTCHNKAHAASADWQKRVDKDRQGRGR